MTEDEALHRYVAALSSEGGTPPITQEEADAVLDLARVVAHTSERRFAPLSAYLIGLAIGAQGGMDGPDRATRVRALAKVAQDLRRPSGEGDG